MKGITICALACALFNQAALADDTNYYIGIKALDVKFTENAELLDGSLEIEDDNGVGIIFGYQFHENWAIELDYQNVDAQSTTYHYSRDGAESVPFSFDVKLNSFGGNVVYKTSGELFFKAKAGIIYEDLEMNESVSRGNYFSESHNNTGFIVAIGGGYIFNHFTFNIDYSKLSTDKDIISAGISYSF